MTPDAFLQAFESGELAPDSFHHRDHVRAAWLCLRRYGLTEGLERFRSALRRLADAAGKPQLYHETITVAYVLLINERAHRMSDGAGWEAFAAANADLLSWKPSVLDAHYEGETLSSDFARRTFVWPDRL